MLNHDIQLYIRYRRVQNCSKTPLTSKEKKTLHGTVLFKLF